MNQINEKLIQAVIRKAEQVCPGVLALIGVYGSVATGDAHAKSDLDLLILIDDERGRELATGMILEDADVGYDLYCTTWDSLRYDAEIYHAHVAKLMDCQIVYVGKEGAYEELCSLRALANQILCSDARFERAEALLLRAKATFADVCLAESLGEARARACYMIDDLTGALMLHNGRYFKYGTRRLFEELAVLPDAEQVIGTILQIAVACEMREIQARCGELLRLVQGLMHPSRAKKAPSADLAGTYEEMYSNWRNKVALAAENEDVFGSFSNLCGLHGMYAELSRDYVLPEQDVMGAFNPDHLAANAQTFDRCLQVYEGAYEKAGICVKRYANADAFIEDYLRN